MVKLAINEATATLFLLDYGKIVKVRAKSLRPFPESLGNTPWFVSNLLLEEYGNPPGDGYRRRITVLCN